MITVIVATYGDDEWKTLADRAAVSARKQADETIVVHLPDGTLAKARNTGAERAKGDYLIFLVRDLRQILREKLTIPVHLWTTNIPIPQPKRDPFKHRISELRSKLQMEIV